VRAAEIDAAERIAAARAARDRRLSTAIAEAERVDAERARDERSAHDQELSAIETAHRGALASLADIADSRIDDLARWALARAIAITGESA
jgi:hypothetical protein